MSNTYAYDVELTDTFGGDANYSWVRREIIRLPRDHTGRALVKAAKKAVRITGMRCKVEDYGDSLRIDPIGCALVCFVTYNEDFDEE